MEQARRLDATECLVIEYRVGRAEDTGLPAGFADVVGAGQCWHWFDGPRAAAEVARILRPDGRLVITHFDWLPLRGNVVEATEKLIEAHNAKWSLGGGMGLYPHWLRQLGEAGYQDLETFSYDVDVPYSHESWRGRVRASAGVGGSLPDDIVRAFDDALARVLTSRYADDPIQVPHRVFALIARPPKSA
jgi:SAM-dependent methyltransferase